MKIRTKKRDDSHVGDLTTYSVREKDLLGIDRGHKPPRELCGDPRVLTPEEIAALEPQKPPRGWIQKPRRRGLRF